MKKLIAAAAVAICVIGVGAVALTLNTTASTANIKISAQAETVAKEEIVEVHVTVSSDVNMGALNSIITYDDTILEFVTDASEEAAGASGTIHIIDTYESGAESAEYVLNFKALEVGQCTISMDETVIEEYDSANVVEANSTPLIINVEKNESVSAETRLSDLIIAQAVVEENFSPDVYEYHATVETMTEQLIFSALPMDSEAVVAVDAPQSLAYGENIIKITVTALSGDVSEYTIYVTRP